MAIAFYNDHYKTILLFIPIPQNNIQYNQLKNIIESYAEKDP